VLEMTDHHNLTHLGIVDVGLLPFLFRVIKFSDAINLAIFILWPAVDCTIEIALIGWSSGHEMHLKYCSYSYRRDRDQIVKQLSYRSACRCVNILWITLMRIFVYGHIFNIILFLRWDWMMRFFE
jgi:hypothetical protein